MQYTRQGNRETATLVEDAELVVLPFVVIGELRADEQTTHQYANLYQQLRRQGTPIPTNDIWIAALVLQHDFVLHARDRHFDSLPQLIRV